MKWEVRTMRSGTSFFDWTVFKKTVCRFWPLWGAYFTIWLLTLPLNGLIMLRMDSGFGYMVNFAADHVPSAAGDECLTLAVIFGAMAAMAVFSHLYNARSANLFGSLPIRREGLFATHYLAGLSFLIVPNAVIFLLTLAVEAAGGIVFWQGLLFWLAVSCGECLFFYSLAVFCAMFTGHILALPTFYGILNGIAAGITVLVQLVLQAFYYGYYGYGMPELVVWLTPVVQLGQRVMADAIASSVPKAELSPEELARVAQWGGIWVTDKRYVILNGLGTVGIYAAAALALTVCAFFVYRARRLESAGDVVAVNPMKPVFKYGVAFCAGLALGIGTTVVTGGGEITLFIAIMVWGVIGCFIAQMLLDKSFKVFHKWKGAAAVAVVLAVLSLIVEFDLTGFETRIPDPASVSSVYVNGINAIYLGDSADWLRGDITDPEVIKLITVLHREAVEQRDEERQTQAMQGGVRTSLDLEYTLSEGGSFSRRYFLWVNPDEAGQEGTAAWALQQIYNNRELYWQVYGFDSLEERLNTPGWRLDQVRYQYYDYEEEYRGETKYYYSGDAQALYEAVKEDFFAGRIGVRTLSEGNSQSYERGYERDVSFVVANEDGYQWEVTIFVQDTASSALAVLEELAEFVDQAGQR